MPLFRTSIFKACLFPVFAVALSVPLATAAEFAGGTGEPADPYQIATAEQLVSIGNNPDLLGKYFRLIDDIDLDPNLPGGQVFSTAVIAASPDPYTSRRRKFTGRFFADGHVIRNLTIDSDDGQYLGLFGYIGTDGRVYNLNLEAVRIRGAARMGALAGYCDGSLVDCMATGSVTGGDSSSWLGGLIGIHAGGMAECRSEVAVSAGDNSFTLGGLVGMLEGRLYNCAASGSVEAGDGAFHLGGLVGMSLEGNMEGCHSDSVVLAGDRSWSLGGLVGRLDSHGALIRCAATGAVTAGQGGHDLGGLVGQNWYGSMSYCRATGDVTAGSGGHTLGGLIGSCLGGRLLACSATGDVTGLAGSRLLGGLAGRIQAASTVTHCYATGRLEVGESLHGRGGLVGRIGSPQDVQVVSCFWDVETSGASDSAAGRGVDTAQMQDRRTFQEAGWDLAGDRADGTADVWNLAAGGSYPALAAFVDPNDRHVLEGAGKSFDPYLIATPEDLGAMVHYNRFAWYRLSADIDLAGITWTTTPVPAFNGVLDGNGHRIANLTIRSAGTEPVGLFGRIESDTWVFDLGLDAVSIVAPDGATDVGGVAGINAGTIVNCYVTGHVTAGAGARSVGGLVGSSRQGTIGDCYATATITGGPDSSQLGGLVGYNFLGPVLTSYAVGMVTAGTDSVHLGALVGYNAERAPVAGCYYLTGANSDLWAMPLTDAQMKQQGSFADWDFAKIWTICADQTYPHLRWEGITCDPQ